MTQSLSGTLAIVVSWLNQYGGAERVLEVVHELFPAAPIFTSTYRPAALPPAYRTWDIRTSFLDRIPIANQRLLFPLYPAAFESLDLRGYDRVLSISSAFAHGGRLPASTQHLCYCQTPARFLWDYANYVECEHMGRLPRAVLPLLVTVMREWDRCAARRVTDFIAISETVRGRIARDYARESDIIHPPVDVNQFAVSDKHDGFFAIISRLIPYKRIDLAIGAFNELGLPLVIAGDGRDRPRLQAMAKSNIRFLGRITDSERSSLLARCRALILPGEEDFGLVPLEANACGKPVIAFASGGALETVVEGVTGRFFREPTAHCLAETANTWVDRQFDPWAIRRHAERFGMGAFKSKLHHLMAD
jgi:glycosyltransferase involved in cell wall biosynthesis